VSLIGKAMDATKQTGNPYLVKANSFLVLILLGFDLTCGVVFRPMAEQREPGTDMKYDDQRYFLC
jgi:hypothetical protein